jgi:putative DNA primase/helicase
MKGTSTVPIHSDARRFLQAVFGNNADLALFANLKPAVHVRDLTGLDSTRDCYWSVGMFAAGELVRRMDRALGVAALVIDDVGTKVAEGPVMLALGEPTAIVETSAGNFQWTYRLTTPVAIGDWHGFAAAIMKLIGCKVDELANPVALYRLPMGINSKPKKNGFAVRLEMLEANNALDPASIHVEITGPGPSGASGGGSVRDIAGLMKLIPNDDVPYDDWITKAERAKALAMDETDAWEGFEPWSAKSSKHDPDETERRWATIKPSRTSGKELLTEAAAADPKGFAAWQAREQKAVFDDGEVAPAIAGPDDIEFFADQEKSSIEVVRYFAGRLKQVGRDDWREFNETTGRWREWTGNHMFRRVLELVNARKKRALDPEVAKKLGSVKFIEQIARAAALHASVVGKVTDFDRNALLLGVPSGVIELGKGRPRTVRPGVASEMVAKAMWVDPAPPGTAHPVWSKFLAEFTQGDASLEEWLQVRAGYCLTGLMDEYVMPFYHGSGGNGKSVYLNALRSVWGEYGTQMEHRLLFEKVGGYHLAPLAVLAGVRLAIVTDVPPAASWDVHIMKMLTGNDAITANRMHQNPITFKSTAKVDVSGNGEPVVKDMDDGVRRRLKLIPTIAKPKVIDKQLDRKLMDEYGAILSWALTGLDMYWALGGLPASKVVDDATREYHALLDPFQRWLDTYVVKDPTPGAKVSTTDLFRSWDAFRSEERNHNTAPLNTGALSRKMRDKGFTFNPMQGYNYLRGYKITKSSAADVF